MTSRYTADHPRATVPPISVPAPLSSQTRHTDVFECYHATVTPSLVILEGPYPEQSNRIIRKYAAYPSQFLRVSFTEEDRLHYRLAKEVVRPDQATIKKY